MLVSESVAIRKALEPEEKKAARERQAKAGPKEGRGKKKRNGSGKLPEAVAGDTRYEVRSRRNTGRWLRR